MYVGSRIVPACNRWILLRRMLVKYASVCMYVYVCVVCMYGMYVYVCVCMCTYVCMYVCVCVYMCTCVCD